MPLLQWWEETAKSNGLSQEQFDSGIKAFVDNEISSLPDTVNEEKLLGENEYLMASFIEKIIYTIIRLRIDFLLINLIKKVIPT